MTAVEPLLTPEKAREFLVSHGYRINIKRLYDWAARGEIPSHKEGKYRYFRQSELATWLNDRMSTPPGEKH